MGFAPDEFTGRTFGKYEVLCRLAVGGMAEIFLGFARSGPFGFQPLVLKRLLSEQREDPTAMRLLIDEARNTATLNHANVARVFDLEVTSEDVLLVIQFINGANLEELIKASVERKELLPVGFVLATLRDAALGLNHAHLHKDAKGQPRPIVHRDVTPRNIMVGFDGVGRVLDFGIARVQGAESRTVAGMVRGTTAYMSPEQAIGHIPDHRSDLFSLGTLLHESLVGQRLFSRENPGKEMAAVYEAVIPIPSQANRRVPKTLDPLVMKLLERPVARRYQTATEFVRDLGLAAGSTTWSQDRCAELVRNLFSTRQKSIANLLEIVANAAGMSDEKTGSGSHQRDPDDEPRTQIDRPNLTRAPPSRFQTNTQPGLDLAQARPTVGDRPLEVSTDPGTKNPARPTDPNREGDDADMPTNFFNPGFDTQDTGNDVLDSTVGRRPGRGRSVWLVAGGIAAMVFGAAGGALITRQAQSTSPVVKPGPDAPGVGRVSIGTDRPAEVQLGGQSLGRTPVTDVYLPSGRTVLRLREVNGQWRETQVLVKKDQMNRFDLKLDTLPVVP